MTDLAYDRNFFAKWIKANRETLEFTEQQFAQELHLSVATTVMWELGNHCWALLPKDVKEDLANLCGEFEVWALSSVASEL